LSSNAAAIPVSGAQVFADGRVPFQTFDASLAAEAYAAVLDGA
jgi:hypothetical protein